MIKMSRAEKDAIESMELIVKYGGDNLLSKEHRKKLDIVLNLINNLQKEIKKEKSRIMELAELLDKQESEIGSLHQELEIQEGCSISKDKIREKLKEIDGKGTFDAKIVLEHLLKEN